MNGPFGGVPKELSVGAIEGVLGALLTGLLEMSPRVGGAVGGAV
jgi:uncharacterized membrane protein